MADWLEVAPQLNAQQYLYCMEVYKGKVYAGTAMNGRLFQWNGVDAWVQVAPQLVTGGVNSQIFALKVYDDGGGDRLYAGTNTGSLFRWNDIDAWQEVAPKLIATECGSLEVYDNGTGKKLYGGMNGARLYVWNGVNAWVEVAPSLNAQTRVKALAKYNNGTGEKLYGGTMNAATGGRLFQWNDVNAWVQVAPHLSNHNYIQSMAVWNNGLYAGTYCAADYTTYRPKLLKWNDVNAWTVAAGAPFLPMNIYGLIDFGGTLYCTTALGEIPHRGSLLQYDGTPLLAYVCDGNLFGQSSVLCTVEFAGGIFAGTGTGGRLFTVFGGGGGPILNPAKNFVVPVLSGMPERRPPMVDIDKTAYDYEVFSGDALNVFSDAQMFKGQSYYLKISAWGDVVYQLLRQNGDVMAEISRNDFYEKVSAYGFRIKSQSGASVKYQLIAYY